MPFALTSRVWALWSFPPAVRTRVETRVLMRDPARRSVTAFMAGQSAHLLYTKAAIWTRDSGLLPARARNERGVSDSGALGASGRHDQSLLHGRHVGSAEFGFHFVQLVRLLRLVVGLNEQLHGERIVLVIFQMSDSVLIFLLIHQQCASSALVGTLNHTVAASAGHGLQFVERLVSQRNVPGS